MKNKSLSDTYIKQKKAHGISSEEVKKHLMKNPKFKQEWERFDLWFEIQQKWLELKLRVISFLEWLK